MFVPMIGTNASSREARVSGGGDETSDAAFLVMVGEMRGRFGAEYAAY
jgi:hypothetical protein